MIAAASNTVINSIYVSTLRHRQTAGLEPGYAGRPVCAGSVALVCGYPGLKPH
jgi:hypothetical protein